MFPENKIAHCKRCVSKQNFLSFPCKCRSKLSKRKKKTKKEGKYRKQKNNEEKDQEHGKITMMRGKDKEERIRKRGGGEAAGSVSSSQH